MNKYIVYLLASVSFIQWSYSQEIPLQEHIKQMYAVAQKQAESIDAEDVARVVYHHPFATVACMAVGMRLPAKLLLVPTKTAGNPALVSLVINGLVVKALAHAYLKYKKIPHSHEGNFVNYTPFLNTHHCCSVDNVDSSKNGNGSDKFDDAQDHSKLQN